MLSKEALEEFKKIWREEKGTDISDEEATEEAINLLNLYNVIYRPIKKEWMEDYEIRKGLKGGDLSGKVKDDSLPEKSDASNTALPEKSL